MVEQLEAEIAEWRAFVARRPAVAGRDVDELEAHLRDQIADLSAVGLAADEAFLVAVKRMGRLDDVSREYAVEHSGRLWKQLVLSGTGGTSAEGGEAAAGPDDPSADAARAWPEALAFAVVAAAAVQVARLAARFPDDHPRWFGRNAALLVIPLLAGWFARRRRLPRRALAIAAVPCVAAALVVNLYPFGADSATEVLAAAHLPVLLWFVVAGTYTGGAVRSPERRMDFVRFTGEWCIYYALLALGGGVLVGLTTLVFQPTGVVSDGRIGAWVLPAGAAGAVIVAAWLVEWKQRIVENMAPVLTTIFTPLFALMLAGAVVVYAATGLGDAFDRELLGVFDALLVVVLGLVLYGLSAREPSARPGWMDRIQFVAVVSALALDAMVLGVMLARVGDLGFTPNRTVALGLNLVLLVDLAGTAWLSARFLTGRGTVHRLERWQTGYLPVFALWAAAVVVVLPLLFAFD
jgi:hypothetical protein